MSHEVPLKCQINSLCVNYCNIANAPKEGNICRYLPISQKKINVYSLKGLNKLQQRQDLIIIKLVAKQNIVLLVQGVTISIQG